MMSFNLIFFETFCQLLKDHCSYRGQLGVWAELHDVIDFIFLKLFVNMRFGISFVEVQFL
jgi:hypothetical protein